MGNFNFVSIHLDFKFIFDIMIQTGSKVNHNFEMYYGNKKKPKATVFVLN